MSATRRTALLLGMTASLVVGSSITASAAYSDRVTTSAGTLTTPRVTAPTSVAVSASCSGSTLNAVVTWPATPAPRVSYALTASVNGMTITGSTATNRFEYSMARQYATYTVPVTVTIAVKTPYGWNATSGSLVGSVTTC
jgi:DNA-binding transcriptional regulator LsrR (DeoR family)